MRLCWGRGCLRSSGRPVPLCGGSTGSRGSGTAARPSPRGGGGKTRSQPPLVAGVWVSGKERAHPIRGPPDPRVRGRGSQGSQTTLQCGRERSFRSEAGPKPGNIHRLSICPNPQTRRARCGEPGFAPRLVNTGLCGEMVGLWQGWRADGPGRCGWALKRSIVVRLWSERWTQRCIQKSQHGGSCGNQMCVRMEELGQFGNWSISLYF